MVCRVLPLVKVGALTVRGPGTKFDYMLIFEGPQGWGKSTLAAVLGGDYFADTGLMIGDKDSYQNIQGVRVYEWGELENMSKQEVSKVKLFVSSPKDRFRASFDKRPRDYPRQVVFVGTTNESHYLTDTTGNRRFWPVRVTQPPDAAWLAAELPQLVSEALHFLDAGERFWPTREEQRELFDPQQQQRTVESSIESSIRHYLYDEDQKVPHGAQNGSLRNEIALGELLAAIGYSIDKQTDVVSKKAGAVMHMLGWEVRRTSLPGRPRVYRRPQASQAIASASGSDGSSTGPAQGLDQHEGHDECPF
jgi:predicted P-loop ATPase